MIYALVVLSSYVSIVVVCFAFLRCFWLWTDCGRRWSFEQGPDIPLDHLTSCSFVGTVLLFFNVMFRCLFLFVCLLLSVFVIVRFVVGGVLMLV